MQSSLHSMKQSIIPSKQQSNQNSHQSQPEPFTQSYKEQVLYPNSIDLILFTIVVYIVYLTADNLAFNTEQMRRSRLQQNYLTNLKAEFQAERQSWFGKARMFVDSYRQITAMNITTNHTNTACNQTRYYCQNTTQGIWNSVENHYKLIQISYKHLIKRLSQKQDSQIFLYNPLFQGQILCYRFAELQSYRISHLVVSQIEQFNGNGYLYRLLNKYISSSQYRVKLLICLAIPAVNNGAKICLITPGSLVDPISNKDNPFKIISQNQLDVYPNYIIPQNNQSSLYNFEGQIAQGVVNSFEKQEDLNFFNSFDLSDCVAKHRKTQYLIENKIRICNPPQLQNLLAQTTIFYYSIIYLKSQYFRQESSSTSKLESFNFQFLIFSNQSFFVQSSTRLKTMNQKQSEVLLSMIFIIFLWLIFMPILPLKVVRGDISLSVSLLIKMCKAVKLIRNKDDLEQQIEIFNKLYTEITKIDHIFYTTIEYFQYFIWYRKWSYATKIAKKKVLLQQGLTLFGSADYAPVTLYIYKKQIQSQIKLVQKYKKMKRIFLQKFFVYENDEKILSNMVKNKSRISPNVNGKYKKSGFLRQSHVMDQDHLFSKDFCMAESIQKNIQNRINKQLQLMQSQKKSKRFVRFSNDLQEQNNKISYKVSKFLLNIPNHVKSKNSQKSIQQQIKKKQQEQVGSYHVESSRDEKIDLKDQQSEPSQRINQRWDMKIKFDQSDEPSSMEISEDQCFDLKRFNLQKLDKKIGQTYQNIFRTYDKIVVSKKIFIQTLETTAVNDEYNQLYEMLIEKLRYTYKFVKQQNKQRQKILKQLSRKLINVKRQKIGMKDLQMIANQKYFDSEKCLHDTISVIEEGLQEESKLIDVQFNQFTSIQEKYRIDLQLIERAKLYQIKILKIMNFPIPYKQLQKLCESKNQQIRIEAKIIQAEQFFHISPHADYEVLMRVMQNLSEPHTTHSQKQKTLKLIKRVLKNRETLQQFQYQTELMINYYNYSHKKIYFVVDLTDNYEVFRPTLEQIYKNMDNVDIFQIMNLGLNENLQEVFVGGSKIKPPKLQDFENQFENLHNQMNKIKSMVSTKAASRRITLQKDFNKILNEIQFEDIDLSRFIVLILGGQNQTQSKTNEDYESTSAQNRQQFQQIHQQIISKVTRNYFHVILIGFNLKDTQTRQGKLKKYIRHAHDVFEIDLSKSNYKNMFKDLCKFMSR